ncbi:MAG: trypsin-like peptidase domain-containing protein, partial [Clostridia bacterium]|nr:trypsin-like peptidase domain-containing protein [Clostridia bacterium]
SDKNNNKNEGNTSSFPITQDSRDGVAYDTVQNVAAKASPSVVNITSYNPSTGKGGYASGIILSKDGYILTNDHIYASIPNARFLITLNDGTEYKAKYVSGDSRSDIAILKITDSVKNLTPATFGKSSELKVGETVLAIGQSSGLSGTVSEGIVSALDRRIRNSNSSYSERHIQTTAAINPGNSGGALVNMQGQVIGVTSSKYADEDIEGICFAIPIDSALKVVKELQEHGKVVSRAKIGITYTAIGTVSSEINKVPTGLYINEISSDSGLYGKGITKGDVITHINGKAIKDDQTVLDIIENSNIGDVLKLTIFINSTSVSKNVDVKLVAAEGGSSYTTQEDTSSSESIFDVIPNPENE